MTLERVVWLLPIGFIVHDGEELLTMPQWVAAHGDDLKHVAEIGWAARRLVAAVPKAMPEIAIAIAIEAILIVLVTAIFARHVTSRRATHVYAAALGVFVAHSLTHAVQPIIFGGYTPGAVSAVTVNPLIGAIVYRQLFLAHLLNAKNALVTTIVGAIVFAPVFAAVVSLARRMAPG